MSTVLVVDDEHNVLYSMKKGLASDKLRVIGAATARQGLEKVRQERPDAVILDVRLPDMSGLDAFEQIRRHDSRLPVVIITAHATTETAIEATKRGAFDYLTKPIDLHRLRAVVAEAVRISHLSHVPALFDQPDSPDDSEPVDRIIGRAPAMQEVYKSIGRVAPQGVSVLILGESGTGKELVARAIYTHSRRNQGPFLALNCAAIPEGLLESELFGHERGSFTGADRRRIGKFEQANYGTVFLDEIGDMSPGTQAKILRLLQDGEFQRVGGSETIHTDVRVIAATNRDLDDLIKTNRFREDLYYRLSVFVIHLPPLRERHEDIPLLADHFRKSCNRELGKAVRAIPEETINLLTAYPWPGNVRELQAAIKYAVVQATGEIVMPQFLPPHLQLDATSQGECPTLPSGSFDLAQLVRKLLAEGGNDIYRRAESAFDRIVLGETLRHTRDNQVLASQLLGISRTTLRAKLSTMAPIDLSPTH